jgi:predicted regulator of Ras-like GTPase activity (Roadblock/LC7/MglB family)
VAHDRALKDTISILKDSGIESATVIDRKGVLVCSEAYIFGNDMEQFSSSTASIMAIAETVFNELKYGIPRRVVSRSASEVLLVLGAGTGLLLAVTFLPEREAEFIPMAEKAASDIRKAQ